MTLLEAIQARRSVRKYIDKPIEENLISILQEKVDEVNRESGLHIQLVTNEPRAFKGKMAYGTFSGVSNYFAMVGKKNDTSTSAAHASVSERIGYYGEQLVLLAQTLGLNTCWVGVTYNNIKEAYEKGDDEKLYCMIALGYGNDSGRNIKRKSIKQVSNASDASTEVGMGATPKWFRDGVAAALLAPTAINQQKFYFEYLEPQGDNTHKVKAKRGFSLIGYTKMDLGIAKLHFEIGAGKENFAWW
ncbi:MAG: nitroreductase [Prevotellaceae bacterium]|nr:nitroreductase [Candidatus Minthosoma caballi]